MARSILVADESPTIRRVVELTFADQGFHVESAADGDAARRAFDSLHPDVVLVDAAMSPPGGRTLCSHVRESGRGVPLLLLTSHGAGPGDDWGETARLPKPFDPDTLLRRVRRLLSEPVETSTPGDDAYLDDLARRLLERLARPPLRRRTREILTEILRDDETPPRRTRSADR